MKILSYFFSSSGFFLPLNTVDILKNVGNQTLTFIVGLLFYTVEVNGGSTD